MYADSDIERRNYKERKIINMLENLKKAEIKSRIKKALCATLAMLFCSVNLCSEASALFGNAHFGLGKKIIQKMDEKLSESEKNTFLSGMVYADIGRFKFDKETGIDSDSDEFAEKMQELAKTSEEKWFARGFAVHVIQDNETKKFLKEILGHGYSSYKDYMLDCGTLDVYFSKNNGILCNEFLNKFNFEQIVSGWDIKDLSKLAGVPEEKVKDFAAIMLTKSSKIPKKNDLTIYSDLIENTYKSLGFKISSEEIYEQAGNILGVFIIVTAILNNKITVSKDLALKIEEKSDELAKLCLDKISL